MNIEIQPNNTKMLVDFHRYDIPTGPPPIGFIHQHPFSEVHIITRGKLTIATGKSLYEIPEDSAVMIPPKFHHCVSNDNRDAKWYAFTTTMPCEKLTYKRFNQGFLTDFFQKLDNNQDGSHSDSIINHIYFICNELTDSGIYEGIPNRDYMEEIYTFLANNYAKNIQVCDIAKALHLSETHTQRIIKENTGNYFGDLLRRQRMLIADLLIQQKSLTMQEIATTVGYSSYSGFYKAYSKYAEKTKNQQA